MDTGRPIYLLLTFISRSIARGSDGLVANCTGQSYTSYFAPSSYQSINQSIDEPGEERGLVVVGQLSALLDEPAGELGESGVGVDGVRRCVVVIVVDKPRRVHVLHATTAAQDKLRCCPLASHCDYTHRSGVALASARPTTGGRAQTIVKSPAKPKIRNISHRCDGATATGNTNREFGEARTDGKLTIHRYRPIT